MHDPDLLVLDEPTDGLDPVGRNEVRKVIERLRDAGKTIFLNSHILQEVEMICTRVAILSKGEICGSGSIDELSAGTLTDRVTIEVALPDCSIDIAEASAKLRRWLGIDTPEDLEVTARPGTPLIHRLSVKLESQAKVDAAVDALRHEGVSIVRLATQRATLEDTFMKLVTASEDIE